MEQMSLNGFYPQTMIINEKELDVNIKNLMQAVCELEHYDQENNVFYQRIWNTDGPSVIFYVDQLSYWLLNQCNGNTVEIRENIKSLLQTLEEVLIRDLQLDKIDEKFKQRDDFIQLCRQRSRENKKQQPAQRHLSDELLKED